MVAVTPDVCYVVRMSDCNGSWLVCRASIVVNESKAVSEAGAPVYVLVDEACKGKSGFGETTVADCPNCCPSDSVVTDVTNCDCVLPKCRSCVGACYSDVNSTDLSSVVEFPLFDISVCP